MNEYLIAVDNYKKPKVISGNKGNYYHILRLMLMEPGTNSLFPLMGLGLRSKSRFITEDQVPDLQLELEKQLNTYLQSLMLTNVEINIGDDKELKITISSDSEEYNFNSNEFDLDLDALIEESSNN